MQKIKHSIQKIAIGVAVAAFWLFVWQLCYWFIHKPLYLASPWQAFQALGVASQKGAFWVDILYSLLRILAGLLIGCFTGIVLSFATERSRILDRLFRPILTLAKTVPVVSFIMLLWLTFFRHRGAMPVLISALMVFPIMWTEMTNASRSMDPKLLEMARYCSDPLHTFLYVRLPHLFPFFLSGLGTSVGLAWKAGIAAEVICRPTKSIGREIYIARDGLESDVLFAWTAVVVLLSLLLERVLVRLLKNIRFRPKVRRSHRYTDNGRSFALEFYDISKHYEAREVIDHFTHIFPNASVTAIIGPSGCGKTTLLHLAAGLLRDDQRAYSMPPTAPGMIFQENRLIPTLTVEENLLFANRGANVERILKSLSLFEDAKRYPHELSGGMQRRVAIGRAIAFGGGIGIFDEPFTGLDAETKALCAQALFGAYAGKTVLFVTHDLEEARQYADEILELKGNL